VPGPSGSFSAPNRSRRLDRLQAGFYKTAKSAGTWPTACSSLGKLTLRKIKTPIKLLSWSKKQ